METPEEEQARLESEEAAAKQTEDAAKKAEETAAAEAQKVDEANRAAAVEAAKKNQPGVQSAQFTDEQWKQLEGTYNLNRQQILGVWALNQAAMVNSPQSKIVEEKMFDKVKNSLTPQMQAVAPEVQKELEKMTPVERMDEGRVREKFQQVIGKMAMEGKLASKPAGNGTGRMTTGTQDGGTVVIEGAGATDLNGLSSDEKEVAKRYGFKDKKDMEKNRAKEIPLNEADWKPVFK